MARGQTNFAEGTFAKSLANVDNISELKIYGNISISENHLKSYFEEEARRENSKSKNKKNSKENISISAKMIRNHMAEKFDLEKSSVYLSGEVKKFKEVIGPDIVVKTEKDNIYVSLKENSKVISNTTAKKIFGIPNLEENEQISPLIKNCYFTEAENEYNDYFLSANGQIFFKEKFNKHIADVKDYHLKATKEERKIFAHYVAELHKKSAKVKIEYVKMCHQVATKLSNKFNIKKQNIFSIKNYFESKDYEKYILEDFFRIDKDESYFLAGTVKWKPFACEIPKLNDFSEEFIILDVNAKPLTEKKHCVVEFTFDVKKKKTNEISIVKILAEVRWSHGKFNGNPEVKLYMSTQDYSTIPWLKMLIN